MLGLIIYVIARPKLLGDVGEGPARTVGFAPLFVLAALVIAGLVGGVFHFNGFERLGQAFGGVAGYLRWLLVAAALAWTVWFVMKQEPADRGPTAAILIFIVFNAVFWLAFEQAGSSLNLFAAEMTDRRMGSFRMPDGTIQPWEMPATWFQSVGPLTIILLAPAFAGMWPALARRGMNPSMPMKIALALFLLGGGFVFMVLGSIGTSPTNRASMFWLIATYTTLTFGELCISPTGLSFVTRAAPTRYVSFLMGVWFLSNFVANKVGGTIAAQVEKIETGQVTLFWYRWFKLGGQADFFLIFVISSIGAGLLVLVLTPLLKRLIAGRE
jgi:POT family proton-dependent oligopeptide transporter